MTRTGWRHVHDEVLRRINTRAWPPGAQIPNEADLATELGCARATVNRALRVVAEAGLIDRRRKGGTRVTAQPVAKATFDIPVIRQEIEGRGRAYGYRLISRHVTVPDDAVRAAMALTPGSEALHLLALHSGDGRPYVVEDRWIGLDEVPDARDISFGTVSGNEWLLAHAPYTHGEIAFSTAHADRVEADALELSPGSGVLLIERLTWNHARAVTRVRLVFPPGHRLRTRI